MMKKILIMGLIALSLLVFGCAQGTLVGHAADDPLPGTIGELCTALQEDCPIGEEPGPEMVTRMECDFVPVGFVGYSGNGWDFCSDNGFGTCVAVRNETYHADYTDHGCTGTLESAISSSVESACGTSFESINRCVGNQRQENTPAGATCCRIVTESRSPPYCMGATLYNETAIRGVETFDCASPPYPIELPQAPPYGCFADSTTDVPNGIGGCFSCGNRICVNLGAQPPALVVQRGVSSDEPCPTYAPIDLGIVTEGCS